MTNSVTEIVVPANRVMDQITVTVRVTGMGWRLFRLRCSLPLVWLAAKLGGVGFDVEVNRDKGW